MSFLRAGGVAPALAATMWPAQTLLAFGGHRLFLGGGLNVYVEHTAVVPGSPVTQAATCA